MILLWEVEPAWQWDMESFIGIKNRVHWKINNKDVALSYYRAFIDEEFFSFAIAADLYSFFKSKNIEKSQKLMEILEYAFIVFKNEVKYLDNNRWLFQPGVWHQHPDYAFVGNTIKEESNEKIIIEDIASDTSHSHRFPLWLNSLASAYPNGSNENEFYKNLLDGLGSQFLTKVLVSPNDDFKYYRTTNFMNGWNGVYRWNYNTKNINDGYGPYELSGTFNIGWWTFLGRKEIKDAYKFMYESYPISEEAIRLYEGPGTKRERHWLVKNSNNYINGYQKLIAFLASEI